MPPKSTARPVRRARKSQLDRRVRRLQEDLDNNLAKVENRLFTSNRQVIATKVFIPEEVRRGVIIPELKELERIHFGENSVTEQSAPETMPPVHHSHHPRLMLGFLGLTELAQIVLSKYDIEE